MFRLAEILHRRRQMIHCLIGADWRWTYRGHGFQIFQSRWQTTSLGWTDPIRTEIGSDGSAHVARYRWIICSAFDVTKCLASFSFSLANDKLPHAVTIFEKSNVIVAFSFRRIIIIIIVLVVVVVIKANGATNHVTGSKPLATPIILSTRTMQNTTVNVSNTVAPFVISHRCLEISRPHTPSDTNMAPNLRWWRRFAVVVLFHFSPFRGMFVDRSSRVTVVVGWR